MWQYTKSMASKSKGVTPKHAKTLQQDVPGNRPKVLFHAILEFIGNILYECTFL